MSAPARSVRYSVHLDAQVGPEPTGPLVGGEHCDAEVDLGQVEPRRTGVSSKRGVALLVLPGADEAVEEGVEVDADVAVAARRRWRPPSACRRSRRRTASSTTSRRSASAPFFAADVQAHLVVPVDRQDQQRASLRDPWAAPAGAARRCSCGARPRRPRRPRCQRRLDEQRRCRAGRSSPRRARCPTRPSAALHVDHAADRAAVARAEAAGEEVDPVEELRVHHRGAAADVEEEGDLHPVEEGERLVGVRPADDELPEDEAARAPRRGSSG